MPINERGYIRPTYDDLLAGRITLARELFGEDIDTSDASALGKFIRLSVQDLADAYEVQEILYYGRFPNTATGQNLDRLLPFAGITRNPPTRAEHEIQFTGTANHEVPVGFLVGTTGAETFYLVNPVTLDETGVGIGIVQCTELGTGGNVRLGDITEIINPDVDVLGITHTDIITVAEDEETDVELRKRFAVAVEGSGSGTAAAIRGAVMRVNGVKSCLIIANTQSVEDEEGRPPNSFEVYVHAPESANLEIGEAIFSRKPLGIKAVGDTTVTVLDITGQEQSVSFSHVAEVEVGIKLTVQKDSHWELSGEAQIKTALMNYIESLGAGEDVIYTGLYKHIFGVAGVKDVTALTISADGSGYSVGNITISSAQVATLSADNIAIEVTDYADR
jgi:uncharacterized phage protein gp47/JayE